MSLQKDTVRRYIEGFTRSDHNQVLSCLTDDIVWELYGQTTLRGKEAFDGEIENDVAVGSPTLVIDRLIEEEDSVVALGHGSFELREGGRMEFVFCEVFTFADDLICRLQTYHVNID